jgi:transposase-like protein
VSGLGCKHCGSGSFVRNGMAHGRQRYRCKACGRSFTATPPRGKPPAMKALAVLLYALGNVSQGMIAKLLGVSHVAVYRWVRAAGEGTPAPSATPSSGIVQIDEMWHFVEGKKTRSLLSGFGVVGWNRLSATLAAPVG